MDVKHTDEWSFRRSFVELADAMCGVGAAPDRREEYLALVAPDEPPAMREAMTTAIVGGGRGMSGCALVVRGLWRRAGVVHPRLAAPYVIGRAVQDVYAIAKEAGALRGASSLLAAPPLPGDVFCVDAPEHVGIVVEVTDVDQVRGGGAIGGGVQIASVDGGQRDAAGWQLVRRRERRFRRGAGALVTTSPARPGLPTGTRRTLLWGVDCWRVYRRFAT